MKRTNFFHGLMAVALLGGATPALADAVVDWNEITVQAVSAGRPGPIGAVDIALVQVAVHDAVQAIDQQFEPYHAEIDTGRGERAQGRRSAAIAAAAHDVLVGIYPAQAATLDTTYFNYLANKGLDSDPGLLVGQQVAARILPLRRANPNPLPPPFVGGTGVGTWRPTPSFLGNPPAPAPFSPMATPWMADFDPFTLTSPTRFRAPPPPALTSGRYTRDYNEVKESGALVSTKRTAEQTDLAYFYVETAPVLWNRALRGIAARYLRKSSDTARLFALANLATADALITCWDSKRFFAVWRPITAIREGEADGNPATVGDPAWQPLINNPNYPDYTSGANSRDRRHDAHPRVVLRHGQGVLRGRECRAAGGAKDPQVLPVLGRRAGRRRCAYLAGDSFPVRGHRGAYPGQKRGRLDLQPFPAATRRP